MTVRSPLVRQWLLLKSLSSRRYGVAIREIAQELGVAQKTIRRDLNVFREVGFPLEETVGERGKKTWRLRPSSNNPPIAFAFDEAISLYLGRRFLEPLAGTVFWEAAQRAFRKLRTLLTPEALKYIERFAEVFHQTTVATSDYSNRAEIIDRLMLGIEDRRAVFITYQSLQSTEPVTYDVYPYGLVYHRDSLYLIGWAPRHQQIRHWKVDRIEMAEVEKFPFQRPQDFDLKDHLAQSFGIPHGQEDVHVKVHFSKTVARYVQEKRWHSSQKLENQKDGSLIAHFDLDGTEEIKRWILSFGRHAIALAPEELRESIANELATLQHEYQTTRVSETNRGGKHERL